jgi:DNA-binding NarL/FixJ family response regulator
MRVSEDEESTTEQPAPGAVIGTAIVEDHREIREGLTQLIDEAEGFRCTGSYPSMEAALSQIDRDLPDVALVDIGLPGMSGIEGIRVLRDRFPSIHLLMLTIYDDDERIFEALCAGATGYMLKKTPAGELGVSVNTIAFHVKRIYEKLQVHSKSEAVSKALRNGIIP